MDINLGTKVCPLRIIVRRYPFACADISSLGVDERRPRSINVPRAPKTMAMEWPTGHHQREVWQMIPAGTSGETQ